MNKYFFGFLLCCLWVVGMVGLATAEPSKPEEGEGAVTAEPAMAPQVLMPPPPAPPACNPLTPSFQNSPNLPITDLNTITATMNISGIAPYLWDVNLVTQITHTYPGDLDIFLISPSGTEVTISTDNLASHDDAFANTRWDDQWILIGQTISDWPFTAVETAAPEEALGAFVGENPNGLWQLVIRDDAEVDEGTLEQWRLEFTTLAQAPRTYQRSATVSGGAIPDGDSASFPLNINEMGHVMDVNVYMQLLHPRNNDLDMNLFSPTGVAIVLSNDNGGTFNNGFAGTLWDDDAGMTNAPGAVTDVIFAMDHAEVALVPEMAMAAFNGTDGNGQWLLHITDDTANGFAGNLTSWEVHLTLGSCEGDIQLGQYPWPYPAPMGGDIEYAIVVSNNGLSPLSDLVLTDTLPLDTTFQSWTAALGWECQTPELGGTGVVSCTAANLAAGQVVTHYLTLASPTQVPLPIAVNKVVVSTADSEMYLNNNEVWASHYVGLTSANGNMMDVVDDQFGEFSSEDDGSIDDGGQDAFDNWGGVRMRVEDENGMVTTGNLHLKNLGMGYVGGRTWHSQTPSTVDDVLVERQLFVPSYADYVRYVDQFTNTGTAERTIFVVWGGNLGSDDQTVLAATSSGDFLLSGTDSWAVTIQSDGQNPTGMAKDPPVGYLWRHPADETFLGTAWWGTDAFSNAWPGNGEDDLGYQFKLELAPGETATLVYFLYRGLAEGKAGPGIVGGYDCFLDCIVPATGSQTALAQTVLGQLAAEPDFCGIPEEVLATVANWPNATSSCPAGYAMYLPLITR